MVDETNEKARSHMQAFVDKFWYNAKRVSLVQSRIKVVRDVCLLHGVDAESQQRPSHSFHGVGAAPRSRSSPPVVARMDSGTNHLLRCCSKGGAAWEKGW